MKKSTIQILNLVVLVHKESPGSWHKDDLWIRRELADLYWDMKAQETESQLHGRKSSFRV